VFTANVDGSTGMATAKAESWPVPVLLREAALHDLRKLEKEGERSVQSCAAASTPVGATRRAKSAASRARTEVRRLPAG
jgi:hypothetical protein